MSTPLPCGGAGCVCVGGGVVLAVAGPVCVRWNVSPSAASSRPPQPDLLRTGDRSFGLVVVGVGAADPSPPHSAHPP